MDGGSIAALATDTSADAAPSGPERRRRLGDFLKAKRAAIPPATYDLPVHRRRRAPGLRREEVALLAGISVAWYTQLESGAPITVSAALLRRLGEVLGLSDLERAYLLTLGIDEMSVLNSLVPELASLAGARIAAESFDREVSLVLAVHRNLKIQIYAACMHGTLEDLRPHLDETLCPIGLWLHDDLPRQRRDDPFYTQAARIHAEFHRQIERVVSLGSHGSMPHAERLLVGPGEYVTASATLERTFSAWGERFRKDLPMIS
jgi:transcriptional regulator with XRE-family HTH domain